MTIANKVSCLICRKEVTNLGLGAHVSFAHKGTVSTGLLKAQAARRGQPGWNKGQTKETNASIAAGAEKLKGRTPPTRSPETLARIAKAMRDGGNCGGYREGSGRGRKGRYDGIWFDSRWELAYYLWCKHNKIDIRRITETILYEFDGTVRKYLPDFLVNGSTVVEIKGLARVTPVIKAKFDAIPTADKMILFGDMFLPIYEWAVDKYGALDLLYDQE